MAYSGKYFPANPLKYRGDATKIVFRSLWERQVFKWCDSNNDLEWWSSEELIIEYRCMTDNKMHRYFPDLVLKYNTGQVLIVEIKPKGLTVPPKVTKTKKRSTLLSESLTYIKNQSKWAAAINYANSRNATFLVWTEDTLAAMGIKTLTRQNIKK